MTVYQISGLGAGQEVFGRIQLQAKTVFIPWLVPHKNESIQSYAVRMAEPIDTSEPFVLMGVSFGGIICQEIAHLIKPRFLILVSTVVSKTEIPWTVKLAAKCGITKLIPTWAMHYLKPVVHYMFGAQNSKDKAFLDNIMANIHPYYLKWSTTQIGLWKPKKNTTNILRFHGKKDKLFPAKALKHVDHWLNAGHFCSYTEGRKVGRAINSFSQRTVYGQ